MGRPPWPNRTTRSAPVSHLYEIINPSDPCTFLAPDVITAFLVVALLGEGRYAAEPQEEGVEKVPLFLFGGSQEWWEKHGDGEPMEGMIDRHLATLVPALRSVCVGRVSERRLFDMALESIDDAAKKAAFVARWNDEKRSSMNDIMGRAHHYAERLSDRWRAVRSQADSAASAP